METLDIPNKTQLIKLMTRNQIEFAALFGSRAKGSARPDSDYDILIEFSPEAHVGLFKFFDIEEDIKKVLGPKVDLVTTRGVSKYMKDEVFSTMKVIYDNRTSK